MRFAIGVAAEGLLPHARLVLLATILFVALHLNGRLLENLFPTIRLTAIKLTAVKVLTSAKLFSNNRPPLHLLLLLPRVLEAHEVARVGREDELPVGVEVEPQRLRSHHHLAPPVLDSETRVGSGRRKRLYRWLP